MKTTDPTKRLVWLSAVTALISIALGCGQHAPTAANVDSALAQDGRLVDLDGSIHRPFVARNVRAVVLVFIVTDCPIANSYAPELNRLYLEYAPRGARIFLIQADPQLSVEDARRHAREYQLQPPVVLDAQHAWVQKVGATKTPEAAVLSPAGELLYLGRIDDRYADLGKRREQVTSHDLRDALEAVLAGRPVERPRSTAVGCTIPDSK
jgi:hypothetical protein